MASVSEKPVAGPKSPGRSAATAAVLAREANSGRFTDVANVLGGQDRIGQVIGSGIAVHDLITVGLPSGAALHVFDHLTFVESTDAAKAMGVSLRTIQRLKKKGGDERLSPDQSDRTWQFAEVLARATEVFGTRQAAERWLNEPAIGLNQRRPIDLLSTTIGTEAVKTYLDRMDYGVYA